MNVYAKAWELLLKRMDVDWPHSNGWSKSKLNRVMLWCLIEAGQAKSSTQPLTEIAKSTLEGDPVMEAWNDPN